MTATNPTESEALFGRFLYDNCIPFQRMEATRDRMPDYEITIGGMAVAVSHLAPREVLVAIVDRLELAAVGRPIEL
jgi:hypothetical protein